MLKDLIEFDSNIEILNVYFNRKKASSTFEKQMDYLRYYAHTPKYNSKMNTSRLMNKYHTKKRMLKFVQLSKILNIPIDNEVFSITSMMMEWQEDKNRNNRNDEVARLISKQEQRKIYK